MSIKRSIFVFLLASSVGLEACSVEAPVLVGAGDIAVAKGRQEDTAKLLDSIVATYADVTIFTSGDNAYPDGTSTDFENLYEPTWGRHKQRTKPTPGNHDYKTKNASGYRKYFSFDTDPSKPLYYSFDLGSWHILMLDSEVDMSVTSKQYAWVQSDLKNQSKPCIAAVWHRPLFNSGDRHGNSSVSKEIFALLRDFGADVVLTGHEHLYERFAPQDSDGKLDQSKGIREFVVGTGGAPLYSFASPKPNSEFRYNANYGVLKLTLHPNSYEWQFVDISKNVVDSSVTPVLCH